MRFYSGLWIISLCALNQGCSPLGNVARSCIIEPIEYCRCLDNMADIHHGYAQARKAWDEFRGDNPEMAFPASFEKGFKDGFADYLYAGGSGNPPPVPPRCYWKHKYETPEGHKVIDDWFAGFRHGATMAKASGLRRLITIPASTAMPSRINRGGNMTPMQPGMQDALPTPQEVVPGPAEVVPPPKVVPPGPASSAPPLLPIPPAPLRPVPVPMDSPSNQEPDDFDDAISEITMPGSDRAPDAN